MKMSKTELTELAEQIQKESECNWEDAMELAYDILTGLIENPYV